jgi:hypothetical protein
LESVELPESVEEIDASAFSGAACAEQVEEDYGHLIF